MTDSTVSDYVNQSFELKSSGAYKQAIEMLYKALEIENDSSDILYRLADLYFMLNNYSRAMQYLEKIIKSDTEYSPAYSLANKIAIREKKYQDAKFYAQKLFNVFPSSKTLAELIYTLGQIDKIEAMDDYLNSDYADDAVRLAVAEVYFDKNYFDKAREVLMDMNGDDVKILQAKIHFNLNEFSDAREIFESFDANSSNPEILNYRGLFAIEDMKFIDAIKYFSKAVNLDNQNSKYLFNLGNAYFFNGWFDESVKAYRKAISLNPENIDYRYALAYLYYEEKSFDKARKEIDVILREDNEYSQAIVLNGLLKLEGKDFLGAQDTLEKNLKKHPDDKFTMTALAKVYNSLGLYDKAERIISALLAEDIQNLTYLSDMCEVYINCKKFDAALNIVDEMKAVNENYISAYILGAKAAYEKKDLDLAKQFAQEVISLDMNCAQGYYYLALVRFDMADCDEAIECMKRAIMHDLNNPLYYAKMSEIYKVNGDLKTAIDYMKEAESIDNSNEYKILYSELVSQNRKNKKIANI